LEQTLDLQKDALHIAGCDPAHLYLDVISGAASSRPGLEQALDYLRAGDTLVVWRLDRLGRSLQHLLDLMTTLERRGIGFRSLTEQLDTTTPGGRLIFHLFASIAEFERDLIRERTLAGLVAARARGRQGGRPKSLDALKPVTVQEAKALYDEGKTSVATLCKMLGGISRTTFYRRVVAGETQAARFERSHKS
jgi:DNA invertase Pin-like site-specific DNA recombinase